MSHPTKVFYADSTGTAAACVVTRRADCEFALIGNFKGEGFRVISIHKRDDLADPASVANSNFTDVRVARRV